MATRPKSSKKKAGARPDAGNAKKGEAILVLPAVADITFAPDFHQQLLKASRHHHSMVVDASAVEKFTSPCAQLLLSAALSLRQADGVLKITAASAAFEDAIRLLGLSPHYQEWRKA